MFSITGTPADIIITVPFLILLKIYCLFPVAGDSRVGDSVWGKSWDTSLTEDKENFAAFGASDKNW